MLCTEEPAARAASTEVCPAIERSAAVPALMSTSPQLTCSGRAVQQHALWLRDAQGIKELGVLQRQLNHLRRGQRQSNSVGKKT